VLTSVTPSLRFPTAMAIYRFPPYEFDPDAGRLQKDGLRIKLQRQPQIVLTALLEERGRILTRQELHKRLWPDGTSVGFDEGLNVAVNKLRHALCDPSDTPKYVATMSGAGYRFIADVEKVEAPAEPINASLGNLQSERWARQTSTSWAPADRAPIPSEKPRAPRSRRAVVLVALFVVLICSLLVVFGRSVLRRHLIGTKSTIAPPPGWEFVTTGEMAGPIILSPDGAIAVFGATNTNSQSMLFLRSLDSLTAEPITGTEGATMPFWSPDGTKISFFADQKLKTLNLADRSVHVVSNVSETSPRGGTWEAGDTILFADSTRGPILKVSASGGTPIPVTDLKQLHSTTHRWPASLPDGHFLFFAANHDQGSSSRPAIFLGSLDGHPPRFLVESDSNALFVAGQLLFVSGGKLLAQPFDPGTGSVGTAATILADAVEYDRRVWHATFAATPQFLVYRQRPKTPETQVITFLDDSGKMIKTAGHPGNFQGVSLSPDGKTVAASCDDPEMNICLIHQDGTLTRVSNEPIDTGPVWAPDGSSLVYITHRGAHRFGIVLKDLKAQNPEQVLMESGDSSVSVTSWSPSQQELLIERINSSNHLELGAFQLADRKYRHFQSGNFNVSAGRFAPDGKWAAYQSDQSGQDHVYVASYPDPKLKYLVSPKGGHAARWSRNGRELYFLDASDMIYRVRIETAGAGLKIGVPQPLFRPPILPPPLDSASFDVSGKEPVFVVDGNVSRNDSEYILVTSWKQ
jgi:eukaryotic-like serine/threonine-protein kinase